MTTIAIKDVDMRDNLDKAYTFFSEVEKWKINTKKRIAKYQAVIIGMSLVVAGLLAYIILN